MKSLFLVLALSTVALIQAQTVAARVTEAQARAAATAAASEAKGDVGKFAKAFSKQIQQLPGAQRYSSKSIPLYDTEDVAVHLYGPVTNFQLSAEERVRKMEALDTAVWNPNVEILVVPRTIEALDIAKILIKRNGQLIEPVENNLVLSERSTRMGVKFNVHQGNVWFPLSVFDGDPKKVDVAVVLIPETGRRNITLTIDRIMLPKIQ